MTVCIVDTSIVVELLNVPGKTQRHKETVRDFATRAKRGEQFLLPVAVLLETGNHVAKVNDGDARRKSAADFVKFALSALDGESPFVTTPFPTIEDVRDWLADFPDRAMTGVGLADRSLIALWDLQCGLHRYQRRVYVWSLDKHLSSYDTSPPI